MTYEGNTFAKVRLSAFPMRRLPVRYVRWHAEPILRDATGRPRHAITMPGYRRGVQPVDVHECSPRTYRKASYYFLTKAHRNVDCHGHPTRRPMVIIVKTCESCGMTYENRNGPKAAALRKYCSHGCSAVASRGPARRKYASVPWEERFWRYVPASPPVQGACWEWTGSRDQNGYGRLSRPGEGHIKAHRASYVLHHGKIAPGLAICHRCDNPPCVNPHHTKPATNAENVARAAALQTHCKHGHEYTEANTGRTGRGARYCRICVNAAHRASYADRAKWYSETER